jgi:hypothetical protein
VEKRERYLLWAFGTVGLRFSGLLIRQNRKKPIQELPCEVVTLFSATHRFIDINLSY